MSEPLASPSGTVKTVLHVGCGRYHPEALQAQFRTPSWKELRLDIDPSGTGHRRQHHRHVQRAQFFP